MNKKLIVLILFVFLLISTVLISLLGKKPDPDKVRANEIVIYPNNGDNFSFIDNQLIVVIDITDLEKTNDKYVINYQINCEVKPDNAVNKNVIYNLYNVELKDYVTITPTGLVTITLDGKIQQDFVILAKTEDSAVGIETKMTIRIVFDQEDSPW